MLGEVAAILSALCAAASSALYRIGVKQADPLHANIGRIWATTLIVLLSLLLTGQFSSYLSMPTGAIVLAGLSGLVGMGIGDTFYFLGIRSIGVARAVPLTFTYPLFTTIAALLFLGEELTSTVVAGTFLILTGLWLLTSRGASDDTKFQKKGVAAAMIAAILWATGITLMAAVVKTVDPYPATAMRMTVSAVVFTSFVPFTGGLREMKKLSQRSWLTMSIGGVMALIIGWILLGYSLSDIGAARAVPLSSVSPLFSVAIGLLFFKEQVTWKIPAGTLLSVIGTVLVTIG
ncbi:MAG: DMT family transporter [Thaumarchaeota archaeon]|nr:DMT family transporter [Nitrososphaerota archaeon]